MSVARKRSVHVETIVFVLGLLEDLYPKLDGQVDLIRLIVHVYRQIQQEAFGIVLINRKNQVSETEREYTLNKVHRWNGFCSQFSGVSCAKRKILLEFSEG